LQAVKRLVKEDPDLLDAGGLIRPTPLAAASRAGDELVVRFLLSEGADANEGYVSPLAEAALAAHAEIGEILIAHGADIERRSGREDATALHLASLRGNASFVEMLVARGADVNARDDPTRNTPLIMAAEAGNADVVRVLLENGADPDLSAVGHTALFHASGNGHTEIVRLLLKYGADPDTALPLFNVRLCGHDDIYRMLEEAQAKKKQAAGRRGHPAR
jgi:hypothetical protein